MKGQMVPSKYFLLDASVLVGYYIPEAIGPTAGENVRIFLESCRKGAHRDWYLVVPNIVIAEVFSSFAKYCFATWNRHVQKALPSGLDQRRYGTIRRRFHEHIHKGQFLHQEELNRYHIPGVDLVAPLDHYFQHYRGKGQKTPMATADMLVLSIGIHLNHRLGPDRFAIVTADSRMADICNKASRGIIRNTAEKLGLVEKADQLGYGYSPKIYPQVINLAKRGKKHLEDVFGCWPLAIPQHSRTGIKKP